MASASLDTNVLVRLIVKDDEAQSLVAAALLAKHGKDSESLFVAVTVMLELEWVLRARYKFSKSEVVRALSSLLMAVELVFESEGPLEQALASYEDSRADYADCLHLALSARRGALPFYTFDSNASREMGAKLLEVKRQVNS